MSEHGLCPTCGRCLCCGLDQKPKVEPAVPFKPVAADWWLNTDLKPRNIEYIENP